MSPARPGGPRYFSMLLLSAMFAFAIGAGVYVFGRDWSGVLFLAPLADSQPAHTELFGSLAGQLPSLTHAYVFSLLIILILWPAGYARRAGATAWILAAFVLECLQSRPVQDAVAAAAHLPIGKSVLAYIVNGHFDALDLLASVLGAMLAYAASSVLEKPS